MITKIIGNINNMPPVIVSRKKEIMAFINNIALETEENLPGQPASEEWKLAIKFHVQDGQ
jgi:hypothetical protein